MSLSVQRLSDVTRTVPIVFDSDEGQIELNVTYRLSAMNLTLSDWLKDHGDDRGAIMGWLERILVKWDIVDDGQVVPATAEAMERYAFSTPLLRLVLDSVYENSASETLKKSYASVSLASETRPRGGRS